MEYAEENLAQILPQRALSAAEAVEMLGPVLDGLAYLHDEGFAHARIKPANILAVNDRLKISSDGIRTIGEPSRELGKLDAYAPPETGRGWFTEAGDVWSLGMTLVETLTQHLPVWDEAEHWEPTVPESIPAPFLEIARGCLRRDPHSRLTVNEIAAQLQHTLARKAPIAEVKTPADAAATERHAPVGAAAGAANAPARPKASNPRSKAARKSGYLIPAMLGAFAVVVAVALVPKLLNHPAAAPEQPPSSSAPTATAGGAQEQPGVAPPSAGQAARPSQTLADSGNAEPIPAPAESAPAPAKEEPAGASGGKSISGAVLDQVLPDVPQRARDTIRGALKLSVRVHVDAAGEVVSAELDSPGPSPYFAQLALGAARRWKFSPAGAAGRGVAGDWILHFEFTREGTRVIPAQEP
jgi:TonB family protein